jgi:hypothetical protein
MMTPAEEMKIGRRRYKVPCWNPLVSGLEASAAVVVGGVLFIHASVHSTVVLDSPPPVP